MNGEQAIKALYEIKIKDKMPEAQREILRALLTQLLSNHEGVALLKEQLTPTLLFNRKLTQALIEEIQQQLGRCDIGLRANILKLLGYIAHGEKIDSVCLWMAISIHLKMGPPESHRLLAEILDAISPKDLEDRYERYGYPLLNPDGGLPFLLGLALDGGTRPYPWLLGLVERVANRVWKTKQVTDVTLDQVYLYLARLSQINPVPFKRADRPLLLLALAHMDKREGLRPLLTTLLQALPEPDPGDQTQRDWRPILAQRIKERLQDPPGSEVPAPELSATGSPPENAASHPGINLQKSERFTAAVPSPLSTAHPPRVSLASFSPSADRSAFKTKPPDTGAADLEGLVQQYFQSTEKLRASAREFREMKEIIKNLERELAAARETIEALEGTLKEREKKLTLVQAKLSAAQEQYETSLHQIERMRNS